MIELFNPPTVSPPFSRYSQGALASPGLRWLHVSGQVGMRPDGGILSGIEAQMHQTWDNVLGVLATAGMTPDHLVKVNVFLTRAQDVALYREIRDERLEGRAPAATLVIVAGLARPELLVEIEAVAAAP
jgi:enamine deaminase RidA (YjgF/YER057c/UK114 family)